MNARSLLMLGQLEGVSPEKLAEGLANNPLAWTTVIFLLMLVGTNVFWVKTVLASYEARIAMMDKVFEALLKTHTGTVTLGIEFTRGLDVMEKIVDQNTRRSEV